MKRCAHRKLLRSRLPVGLALAACLALGGCAAPVQQPAIVVELVSTPAPMPVVTPEPKEDRLAAGEGVYTIAWISDTQHYSAEYPEHFHAVTGFLRDEQARLKLGYVVHTGDLVHNHDSQEEWLRAVRAMSALGRIPHGVLAGNHDVGGSDADYTHFSAYFGEKQMQGRDYYGGSYKDNRGHYDLISLGQTDYIFVYVGYAPNSGLIAWAAEAFAAHPDRVGVLCAHDYFKTDMTRSGDGKRLYEKVVKKSPNVYLVLCGHRYNVGCQAAELDDDGDGSAERTVYQMMCNYQAAGDEGGSGYIRLMQVDERAGEIRMLAYSPVLDDHKYFDTPQAQQEKYPADPDDEEFVLPIMWG